MWTKQHILKNQQTRELIITQKHHTNTSKTWTAYITLWVAYTNRGCTSGVTTTATVITQQISTDMTTTATTHIPAAEQALTWPQLQPLTPQQISKHWHDHNCNHSHPSRSANTDVTTVATQQTLMLPQPQPVTDLQLVLQGGHVTLDGFLLALQGLHRCQVFAQVIHRQQVGLLRDSLIDVIHIAVESVDLQSSSQTTLVVVEVSLQVLPPEQGNWKYEWANECWSV